MAGRGRLTHRLAHGRWWNRIAALLGARLGAPSPARRRRSTGRRRPFLQQPPPQEQSHLSADPPCAVEPKHASQQTTPQQTCPQTMPPVLRTATQQLTRILWRRWRSCSSVCRPRGAEGELRRSHTLTRSTASLLRWVGLSAVPVFLRTPALVAMAVAGKRSRVSRGGGTGSRALGCGGEAGCCVPVLGRSRLTVARRSSCMILRLCARCRSAMRCSRSARSRDPPTRLRHCTGRVGLWCVPCCADSRARERRR